MSQIVIHFAVPQTVIIDDRDPKPGEDGFISALEQCWINARTGATWQIAGKRGGWLFESSIGPLSHKEIKKFASRLTEGERIKLQIT